jgi:hypothetical protein
MPVSKLNVTASLPRSHHQLVSMQDDDKSGLDKADNDLISRFVFPLIGL